MSTCPTHRAGLYVAPNNTPPLERGCTCGLQNGHPGDCEPKS